MDIPTPILSKMNFEEFKAECDKVFHMKNDELKSAFPDEPLTYEEIRGKYKKLLDTISEEEFNNQKTIYEANTMKQEGNKLFKESKFNESLESYQKSMELLNKLKNNENIEDLISTLRLNISLVYMKLDKPQEAISECKKVNF